MYKFSSYGLDSCEQGTTAYSLCSGHHKKIVCTRTLIQGILLLVLFNVCLLTILYLFFIYMENLPDMQRSKIINVICTVFTVIIITLLIYIGDLSKNNPNFYYI